MDCCHISRPGTLGQSYFGTRRWRSVASIYLPVSCFLTKLCDSFVYHPYPVAPKGWPIAKRPPPVLVGISPFNAVRPVSRRFPGLTFSYEVKRFQLLKFAYVDASCTCTNQLPGGLCCCFGSFYGGWFCTVRTECRVVAPSPIIIS
ncbi:MAG: hypothetical protein CM1200mP35_03810 [Chloroflexota bacterium]|nr:MAG: hypothetical protein CM1200mP35_03810 [Chloroflexota bacterium]